MNISGDADIKINKKILSKYLIVQIFAILSLWLIILIMNVAINILTDVAFAILILLSLVSFLVYYIAKVAKCNEDTYPMLCNAECVYMFVSPTITIAKDSLLIEFDLEYVLNNTECLEYDSNTDVLKFSARKVNLFYNTKRINCDIELSITNAKELYSLLHLD